MEDKTQIPDAEEKGVTLSNDNPVTSLEMHTVDGTDLLFTFDPPVHQSLIMIVMGRLHADLGVELNVEFPEKENRFNAR